MTAAETPAGVAIGTDEIRRVHEIIRPYLRRTPVLQVEPRALAVDGTSVYLKLEQLQGPARSRRAARSRTSCSATSPRRG